MQVQNTSSLSAPTQGEPQLKLSILQDFIIILCNSDTNEPPVVLLRLLTTHALLLYHQSDNSQDLNRFLMNSYISLGFS